MNIVWQSFVDQELNAPYISRLESYLKANSSADTNIKVIGITPPARDFGRLQEFRCAASAIRNAIVAEREGADAFEFHPEHGVHQLRGGAAEQPIVEDAADVEEHGVDAVVVDLVHTPNLSSSHPSIVAISSSRASSSPWPAP